MSEDEADEQRERDPFGRLDEEVGDREGDPFADLPEEPDGDGTGRAPDDGTDLAPDDRTDPAPDDRTDPAPDEIQEVDEPAVRPGTPETGDATADTPTGQGLETSAGDSSESVPDRGDPFEGEGAFEQMGVGEVDPDEVWAEIADARTRGSVKQTGERDYAEVSKHRYCERCEHFTDPPEVRCTNEGTEILEFVDADTVRVVDCPIVAERRALRRGTGSEE